MSGRTARTKWILRRARSRSRISEACGGRPGSLGCSSPPAPPGGRRAVRSRCRNREPTACTATAAPCRRDDRAARVPRGPVTVPRMRIALPFPQASSFGRWEGYRHGGRLQPPPKFTPTPARSGTASPARLMALPPAIPDNLHERRPDTEMALSREKRRTRRSSWIVEWQHGRSGGIGRHDRLKICWEQSRGGSNPPSGTMTAPSSGRSVGAPRFLGRWRCPPGESEPFEQTRDSREGSFNGAQPGVEAIDSGVDITTQVVNHPSKTDAERGTDRNDRDDDRNGSGIHVLPLRREPRFRHSDPRLCGGRPQVPGTRPVWSLAVRAALAISRRRRRAPGARCSRGAARRRRSPGPRRRCAR